MLTRNPRALSIAPIDADVIPLPEPETTPPVTKIYFVCFSLTPPSVLSSVRGAYAYLQGFCERFLDKPATIGQPARELYQAEDHGQHYNLRNYS